MEFRQYYRAYDPTQVRTLSDTVRLRYEALLDGWAKRLDGRRLLEVGCGNGHFMAVARERGWRPRGVELSEAHVARARAHGLDVVHGDLVEDDLWDSETFDVAVAIEVLEHVPHPATLLAGMTARLADGGLLYLTTPNYGSVTRRLLGARWSVLDPEHVVLTTPRGLRTALDSCGIQTLRLRSKNLYLSEYRRVLRGDDGGASGSRAEAAAELRDRIEESRVLRMFKYTANTFLGVTGMGEGLECLGMRTPR